MNRTSIEWCARPETGGIAGAFTWNPIRARLKGQGPKVRSGTFCTRISPGCTHCYASSINKRFGNGLEYTVPNLEQVEFFVDEKILEEPLRRKKPATIFVGDMFDLFHEAIPFSLIDDVIMTAATAHWHTFQFLTKRTKRLYDYAMQVLYQAEKRNATPIWPKPNFWAGTSVESQQYADERIPLLLQTPAAVRFLSVEPMLEAVTLTRHHQFCPEHDFAGGFCAKWHDGVRSVDWLICGGESGPGARPFSLAWAESLLTQCRAAGVPFFMKQVGSRPFVGAKPIGDERIAKLSRGLPHIKDRKGGNPEDWPESLRVREFPAERLVSA